MVSEARNNRFNFNKLITTPHTGYGLVLKLIDERPSSVLLSEFPSSLKLNAQPTVQLPSDSRAHITLEVSLVDAVDRSHFSKPAQLAQVKLT